MFSAFSLPFSLPGFLSGRSDRVINLDRTAVHDVETDPERRPRTLKHLLKANHVNHAILYHDFELPNQAVNLLCSAYILGANPEHLTELYEDQTHTVDSWPDIVGGVEDDVWRAHEISTEDWREFLGKRNHQRAFIDFYEDQLVALGYNWKQLLDHYLYNVDSPLAYTLISGAGTSLQHLATAHQFNSREIGIEALSLLSCLHDPALPKYFTDAAYTRPSSYPSSPSVLVILDNLASDHRFVDLSESDTPSLLRKREDAILDHWNAWSLSSTANPSPDDLRAAFRSAQVAAVALAAATTTSSSSSTSSTSTSLLTPLLTSHALRTLLPETPPHFTLPLLKQWLLLTLLTYVAANRPRIDPSLLDHTSPPTSTTLSGDKWKSITHSALTSAGISKIPERVQALLALRTAADTWGQDLERGELGAERGEEGMTDKEVEVEKQGRNSWWVRAAGRLVGEWEGK